MEKQRNIQQDDSKKCVSKFVQTELENRTNTENKFPRADMTKNTEITNNYKVFSKFVEDSLTNMSKMNADQAVLEIVDVIYKYERDEL